MPRRLSSVCFIGLFFVIALFDPFIARASEWSDRFWLPGLDGSVYCTTEWNGKMVVGGAFSYADGKPASGIAVWD